MGPVGEAGKAEPILAEVRAPHMNVTIVTARRHQAVVRREDDGAAGPWIVTAQGERARRVAGANQRHHAAAIATGQRPTVQRPAEAVDAAHEVPAQEAALV